MARLKLVSCAGGPFRRAGLAFGPEPVLVDFDEIGEERAAAIEAEQMLTIEEADAEAIAARVRQRGDADPRADELEREIAELRTDVEDLTAARDGMGTVLASAVSPVLSRFAPDMALAPAEGETVIETQLRLLGQLVTHETPCDKRIASLESELSSTRSQLSAAQARIAELEAAAAKADGAPADGAPGKSSPAKTGSRRSADEPGGKS